MEADAASFFSIESAIHDHDGNSPIFMVDPAAAEASYVSVATPTEQQPVSLGQLMQELTAQHTPTRKRSAKGCSEKDPSSSTDTVAKPNLFKCSSCSTKKPSSAFEEGANWPVAGSCFSF